MTPILQSGNLAGGERSAAGTLQAPMCFAANASEGQGGQGEFLRQMIYAADRFPHGRILSRQANRSREAWPQGCLRFSALRLLVHSRSVEGCSSVLNVRASCSPTEWLLRRTPSAKSCCFPADSTQPVQEPMRSSLVLSANASPQLGGQGLNLYHVVNGLKEYFDISLFCRDLFPEVPTQIVPPSTLSTCIGSVPGLRRLRDLQNHWSDVHFDEFVSQRLSPAKLFQGVSGQCYRSLKRARSLGCKTVVDSITTHIDDFVEQQRRECSKFNIRPQPAKRHVGSRLVSTSVRI